MCSANTFAGKALNNPVIHWEIWSSNNFYKVSDFNDNDVLSLMLQSCDLPKKENMAETTSDVLPFNYLRSEKGETADIHMGYVFNPQG